MLKRPRVVILEKLVQQYPMNSKKKGTFIKAAKKK